MARQRSSTWATEIIEDALAKTIPDEESIKWEFSNLTVIDPETSRIQLDPYYVLWISIDQGDEVFIETTLTVQIFSVTEEEIRDHVKNVWNACLVDRMEIEF